MSNTTMKVAQTFRKRFSLPDNDLMRWFPGHMNKAMNQMQSRFKDTDCIIEIHDARIPISGRNPRFNDIIALRPHVLLLNKFDLCDGSLKGKIVDKLQMMGVEKILFTNCLKFKSREIQTEIIPAVIDAVNARPRYNRKDALDYNLMVIGVPNTGKSTFINAVRRMHTTKKKKATRVGAIAGITRSVNSGIRVHFDPEIFLVDTPGILTPTIPNIESGMRLSLCGCLPDHLVGEQYIVDYMLFWLNKHNFFSYVDVFELTEPTDNVLSFLSHVAKKEKMVKKIRDINSRHHHYVYKPDFNHAAQHVLKKFRTGELGSFTLDCDLL